MLMPKAIAARTSISNEMTSLTLMGVTSLVGVPPPCIVIIAWVYLLVNPLFYLFSKIFFRPFSAGNLHRLPSRACL